MRPPTASERLYRLHHLYEQLGSLEAVGRQVGLTRERVRQLLAHGTRRGLFVYHPRRLPCVPKERLVADYKAVRSLSQLARRYRLSVRQLKQLLAEHAITPSHLVQYRREGRQARCVTDYRQLVAAVGRHLSAGDLHRCPEGLALYARIMRCWGSIHAFRAALQIAAPSKAGRPPLLSRAERGEAGQACLGPSRSGAHRIASGEACAEPGAA